MLYPILFLAVCALLACSFSAEAEGPAQADFIVPRPLKVESLGAGFVIQPSTAIVTDDDPETLSVARYLAGCLRTATGYSLPVQVSPKPAPKGSISLTATGADASLGEEGYELASTPEGVTIRAPHAAGLFHGVQSLRQLLPPEVENQRVTHGVEWRVAGVRVWDVPRFPVRSFMLDSSRHMQSVAYIKRTLDRLAFHKINTFHWHITDDQGWRLPIRKYPKLTQVGGWRGANEDRYGGFYTQAQIRDIVKYARSRFITIVPEVDMPGHTVAALAAYPELGCTGGPYEVRRAWGIADDVLCIGKESTFKFVDDVLTELLELFPGKVIHIGGDECPRVRWKTCPHCQALMKAKGFTDEDALQNYFTRHVMEFLASKGRRMQGWNEIMAGGDLPKDVIVHQWNWPNAGADAARAGNDVVYSMHPRLYFDYDYEATPLRKVYDCEPVPEELDAKSAAHILGPEACLWTEYRPTEAAVDDFLWPRVIALAEVGWTARDRKDWESFTDRMMDGHYQRIVKMGLGQPGLPPGALQTHLLEHSEFSPGERIGSWAPQQMDQTYRTLEWDVTAQIKSAGLAHVTFLYEAGAQGLDIEWTALAVEGVEAVRDAHNGWAGLKRQGNTYSLRLPEYRSGARYTVRASVKTDTSHDTAGGVWLRTPR